RLKGGDPVLSGRGAEEAEELAKAGLAFEIVPGITSALAGPIYAGVPVTYREHASSLTIFTGHEDPDKDETQIDYAQLAKTGGTLIMLMGIGRIGAIAAQLMEGGLAADTPVTLLRRATTGRQTTLIGQLDNIAELVESS